MRLARAASRESLPDAALFLADRVVAFDHDEGDAYVVALVPDAAAELVEYAAGLTGAAAAVAEGVVRLAEEEAESEARAWMAETERALLALAAEEFAAEERGDDRGSDESADVDPADAAAAAATAAARRMRDEDAASDAAGTRRRSRDVAIRAPPRLRRATKSRTIRRRYPSESKRHRSRRDVRGVPDEPVDETRRARGGGSPEKESTETPGRGTPGAPDPATLYSTLRRTNPAPYAAYLCFGGCGGAEMGGAEKARHARGRRCRTRWRCVARRPSVSFG